MEIVKMTEVAGQVMEHMRSQSMNGARKYGCPLGEKVNFNS